MGRHFSIYKLKNGGKLSCPTCREIIPLPEKGIAGFKNDAVAVKVKEILKKLPAILDDVGSVSGRPLFGDSDGNDSGIDLVKGSVQNLAGSVVSAMGSMILGSNPDSGNTDDDGEVSDDDRPSRPRQYTKPVRDPADVEETQSLAAAEAASMASMGAMAAFTDSHSRRQAVEDPETTKIRGSLRQQQEKLQDALARMRMKVLLLYRMENHVKRSLELEVAAKAAKQTGNHVEKPKNRSGGKLQLKKIQNALEDKNAPTLGLLASEQDKLYRKLVEVKALHDILEEILGRATPAQLRATQAYLLGLGKKLQPLVDKVLAGDKEHLLKGMGLPQDLINMVENELEACRNTVLTAAMPVRDPRRIGIQFLFKISGYGSGPGRFDFPTHATFMPNGDILVSDKNNLRLQIFNCWGQFKYELAKNHIKPRRARVNPKDGLIYVSDEQSETVKVFNERGELLRRIGEGYFQCVAGLDFDSKGNVIMSDPEKGYITSHSPHTGETLTKFVFRYLNDRKMPNPYYLCVNEDDHVIVADSRNDKLKVFAEGGHLLFQIPKLDCPRGVTVDPYGNILVAEGDKHRVSMYNPYGKFIQNLLESEEFGLRYPLSLDMDKDGRLLVTQCGYTSAHEVLVFQMG